jgi:DNA-binding winged helix-turn-helix (wHTH) protein/tetratricopeptide (TPR) repeat protein
MGGHHHLRSSSANVRVDRRRLFGAPMKSFQPFRLDEVNQCLWRGDTRVSLMPKPFAVLRYLVDHSGRLVTQDELLTAIWPDTYVQPEVLRRYILEIRRALGDQADHPRFIRTFPKRGYEFIAGVVSDNAASSPDGVVQSPQRLVGRQSVLADLDRYLSAALLGKRQLVFVVGEPGIGKTSLVDAFQQAVGSRGVACVARGQSVEGFGGKEPYYPIFEALGQLARGPEQTRLIATLAASAPTWLVQFPSLTRAEQQAALHREIAGATPERMVRELCEALEAFTDKIPLVIVLEDLHWADHSTLDLMSAMARRRVHAKLLVLGTYRPADLIVAHSPLKTLKQDLLLHHLCHELTLEGLAESDVAAYLAAEFAGSDLPSGLAAVVHRHSDGNPLFMTAMLDHLSQQGVLSKVNGRWTLTVPLDRVNPGVPDTLRQMLEIQLQHLSDAEQQLLMCASVAGLTFAAWAVAMMLARDVADFEDTCAALADRQQFLKLHGTLELSNGTSTSEYEFRHALYREVLYRRLTPTRRADFHRRLAKGLEDLRPRVDLELAAELALHFEAGREYERAVQYLMSAAQNATRRYAHREAITVLEHARDLLAKVAADRRPPLELQILERIGNAFYALGDMDRSAKTYETLAARAAETGLLASYASALMRLPHTTESIPFFVRAVQLDPTFAFAYTRLSTIYSTLGDAARAKEYANMAYERREHVAERERLSITYQYHYDVTGNQTRATDTLEVWKHAFPNEFEPVNSLALIHNFLGRFERAVQEGHEAVRRNPSHGYPYSNLAHAYRGLGRFDEAQKTAEQAVALHIETLPTRRLLYELAVIAGDEPAALNHLDWARDKPREFDMAKGRAQVAGWLGRVREARALYEEAARLAEVRNLADVGTSHLAWGTWMELAYGDTEAACEQARRVMSRNPSYDPRLRAALALAATGFEDEAAAIATDLSRDNPEHTFINSVLVPVVRAAIELSRKQPLKALKHLEKVACYELGFVAALAPVHLRGQAYLLMGAGEKAAEQFQRLLDHRGSEPFSPFHAVAPLGLARARAMTGDKAASLEAYGQFFTAWTGADRDIPVLRDAREEYVRLTRGPRSLS